MPKSSKRRRDREAAHQRANRARGIEYLGGKCLICGNAFHPLVYDFHHLGEKEKVSKMTDLRSRSWERFRAELDKCVLLCAGCHRLLHGGLVSLERDHAGVLNVRWT